MIAAKEGVNLYKEEIQDFCQKNLAVSQVAKIVEFRTELPKSGVGKVLRRILKEESARKQEESPA
jgi:long-chain acyl-CoA synthetase